MNQYAIITLPYRPSSFDIYFVEAKNYLEAIDEFKTNARRGTGEYAIFNVDTELRKTITIREFKRITKFDV